MEAFLTEWQARRFSLVFLAEHVILLAGWRRHLVATLAGLVAALSLQPVSLFPALAIAFPLLVWLVDGTAGQPVRKALPAAFAIGWSFGFGYFLGGLWWLGAAFIIGGEQFVWLLPLGVLGLPAALAVFMGLGLAVARLLWSPGVSRLFALGFGLGLSEWARAHAFTGFPWNGFGQGFADHLLLAQAVSLVGAEGLGLLAILIFATPAMLGTGLRFRDSRLPVILAGLVLFGLAIFGFVRLYPTGGLQVDLARIALVPEIRLRIMQPNVAQEEKNNPGSGAVLLDRYIQLSERQTQPRVDGTAGFTHLIWPEAPFPFVLDREPKAIERIAGMLSGGAVLVTGAIRAEEAPEEARRYRFYNSIQILDRNGLQGTYDKVHLVPFGEYLPFESVLRALGFEQFVRVIGGFSASPRRQDLDVPGLPVTIPVICFETIFPHELAAAEAGQGLFLNVTNDAWFGATAGPYQHLAQARLRAIEFGQPMVRAANSGISAVFDPYGRMIAKLPLGRADVMDAPLPSALSGTLYRQTIWYSYATVMILLVLGSLPGLIRRRRPPRG